MTSPRPYVAAAAAAVLAAVFFVPSATASPGHDSTAKTTSTSTKTNNTLTVEHHATAKVVLADTGAIDTKPYVIGGASFLVAGAGLILNAGRRARQAAV
ncbi:hypothetical protein AB0M29_00680 [Streptomyces sp. NPDC051976]|uniref:hypothetical protein n=1 Tax=Streptomyces sp. NPDC051976 TaxID=3154947 RepID=UPI0034485807